MNRKVRKASLRTTKGIAPLAAGMSHLDQAAALATVDKTPEQLEAELWMQKRRSLRATTKRLLLLSKLAYGLSTESIERIATAMPHILAEAVNELDGKVEYVMVTK